MGGADEVKGLIQLAGGIIMGGLALYKLTNVDEAYEMEEPVSYQPEKRPKLTKAKQAVAPSRPHEGKSSRGDGDGRGVVSWRSSEEVAEVEAEELGSWRSKREELEAIEFEKESKESSSVPSTSASSENFDSDDEDHVPSWMSKKDPQVGISSELIPQTSFAPQKLSAAEGVMRSGNESISHLAHALSDTIFVYPLTSTEHSSYFGQPSVELSQEKGRSQHSAFGHGVDVKVMETRAGAGSAVLGSLMGGSKTTVLSNSETLKYMLPSMFEIADNRLATVFHVAACKIEPATLEITSDFSDIMRVRETGFAMLGAGSSQEIFDLGVVAHVAAQQLSTPVLHFFDAVRGLDEISKIRAAQMEQVAESILEAGSKRGLASTFGLEAAASQDSPYLATAIQDVMKKVSPMLGSGREYKIIEYHGPAAPEAVVVALGTTATTLANVVHESGQQNVGVVNVRLLRPWSSWHFLSVLPKSVKKICVLDQAGTLNPLFLDVASALHSDTARSLYSAPLLVGGRVNVGGLGFDKIMAHAVISNILADRPQSNFTVTEENHPVTDNAYKNTDICEIVVLGENADVSDATKALAIELGAATGLQVQQMATQDPYTFLFRSDLRIADIHAELPEGHAIKAADVVVANEDNLETAVATVRRGGSIVLAGNVSSLGQEYKAAVVNKGIDLYSLNHLPEVDDKEKLSWLEIVAALALGGSEAYAGFFPYVRNAFRISGNPELSDVAEHITKHLTKHGHTFFQPAFSEASEDPLDVLSAGSMSQANSQKTRIPKYSPRFAVGGATEEKTVIEEKAEVVSQHELAWSLMFKETFETHTALRPAHHDVHFARVTKLQRLTPDDYSRNIFHMEFDISSTPLKYQIGDALGVFGHNDEADVDKFIADYGLDPNAFVRLPQRGALSKSNHNNREYISARNLLVQHLDLFGRPSKKFYTALAQFATSRYEYLRLMHIGTDDTESFKLGIHETLNFADILLQYKTARPSIEELAVMIPEIKARHYSISSSMKVSPRSVHLLVVAVDWETPLGKRRSGQCTRYLKNLSVGDVVSVDIQQSVLRLPPNPTQPIVMAGLGTGMAPFRAFLQERLWQREAGIKVGPCVLYFGARHKAQEWLYGEELEKYERMGLVRLGLAWSRDQKHKVYIQHKIKEDSGLLKELLGEKEGYFYLCGPTWPVPDVRDAIASGLTPEKIGPDGEVDVEAVQELKDEGRYILEVY